MYLVVSISKSITKIRGILHIYVLDLIKYSKSTALCAKYTVLISYVQVTKAFQNFYLRAIAERELDFEDSICLRCRTTIS
jgi:hypothetical protein